MNTNRLKKDMKALVERIRGVKAELRTTWTKPMGDLQLEHLELKERITELYILRAWLRGKQHLANGELCKEIAQSKMTEYQAEAA